MCRESSIGSLTLTYRPSFPAWSSRVLSYLSYVPLSLCLFCGIRCGLQELVLLSLILASMLYTCSFTQLLTHCIVMYGIF